MRMRSFAEIVAAARGAPPSPVAVAVAEEREVLEAIKEAQDLGLAEGLFVGDEAAIAELAAEVGLPLAPGQVRHVPDPGAATAAAVEAVRSGEAHILMKGLVETSRFVRAILDRERGLRHTERLSHLGVVEFEGRLLFVTDAAINVAPDLLTKAQIIQNAVDAVRLLGIETPRVAVLAAIELVNPAMPATTDAAELSKMGERGQIRGCIVDGPLALDNALSAEAAEAKGIESPVAGRPDILVVPNIESGNILYKSFTYFTHTATAGVVLGARAPVVLTSRADPHPSKVLSIAVARAMALAGRERTPFQRVRGYPFPDW